MTKVPICSLSHDQMRNQVYDLFLNYFYAIFFVQSLDKLFLKKLTNRNTNILKGFINKLTGSFLI